MPQADMLTTVQSLHPDCTVTEVPGNPNMFGEYVFLCTRQDGSKFNVSLHDSCTIEEDDSTWLSSWDEDWQSEIDDDEGYAN